MEFKFDEQPEVIQKFIILGAVYLYHYICHENPPDDYIPILVTNMMLDNDIKPRQMAKLLNDTMTEMGIITQGEAEARNDLNQAHPDKGAVKPYLN